MKHLDEERLGALLDGALEGAARAGAERHLEGCAACRDALADLAALDRELRPALEHDPGDAYFEGFAARVGGRLRAEGLKGAQARERPGTWLAEWFRSPRKLALLGTVATLVAGAGIVMLSTREVRFPLLRRGEPVATPLAQAPAGEATPAPATTSIEGAPATGGAATPKRAASALDRGRAPAATGRQAGEPAAERRTPDSREEMIVGSAPTASEDAVARGEGGRAIAPSRLQQVRRDERGEDVAVGPPNPFPYAPRTKSFTPAPPGVPTRVVKDNVATPLQSAAEREEKAAPANAPLARGVAGEVRTQEESAVRARVCGTLVDDAGRPVAGAQVADPATGVTATSAADGSFCLEGAPREVRVLAIGFEPATRAVTPGERARIALAPVPVLRRPAGMQSLRGGAGTGSWDQQPTWTATHGRNAQRLTALAERVKVAPAWDSAAAEWALTLEGASGGPLENEARYQLARARWMAWRLGPTARRASATRSALDGFLGSAPRGAQRDSAGAWSGALGR